MAQIRLTTIPRPQPGTSTSLRTSKPQQAPATLLRSPPHQSSITEECAKAESAAQVIVTYTTISEYQHVKHWQLRPYRYRDTDLRAWHLPIGRKTQVSSLFPERVVW